MRRGGRGRVGTRLDEGRERLVDVLVVGAAVVVLAALSALGEVVDHRADLVARRGGCRCRCCCCR